MQNLKRTNYFLKQTKKGPVAFFGERKSLPLVRKGFLKLVTIKGVTKGFNITLEKTLSAEERIVTTKIFDLLSLDNKISYNELYSRVSSFFAKRGLKLGKRPINNNSVETLYKKLVKIGAIAEEKQTPKK